MSRLVLRFGVILAFVNAVGRVESVHGQITDRHTVVTAIDSLFAEPLNEGRIAGASIGVIYRGDTVVLKGYGYADLEHDVPTPANAVYEIGSVTKQFTAAAVLKLVDEGKLDLDADVTDYLPDYPTDGRAVPIRRLMDHTSGIKGYTEMPTFGSVAAERLPRDTLVAMFSAEPWDFEPGDALIYNNSAYYLLGLIIEKLTGQGYEEVVRSHLFEPAGMSSSLYCSNRDVIKGRAHGYEGSENGLVRGGYLDHTWPYAAGSLCSTAADLLAWNRALHGEGNGGKLLSPSSYQQLVTPGHLNDGTPVRYAKGLAIVDFGEKRMIAHGGGIPGFLSDLRYFPDDDLTIVILINTAGPVSPAELSRAVAALILGEPDEPASRAYNGDLTELVGSYTGAARGSELTVTVARDGRDLTVKLGTSEPQTLRYLNDLTFGRGDARFRFIRRNNAIATLQVDQVSGVYVLAKNPS